MSKQKQLRVLFLDDRSKRFTAAMKRWKDDDLTIVCTSKECIKLLSTEKFDIISLDHDLGFEEFVPSMMPNTGMEVVRYICANIDYFFRLNSFAQIIVHTANEPAGYMMVQRLHEVGFKKTRYIRFEYDE